MTLYLGPERSGVEWLLDPESAELPDLLRDSVGRGPASACDPAAVADDLEEFEQLLRSRHFGLATGVADAGGLSEIIEAWRERLCREQPRTWGAALGTDVYRLRVALGDNHLRAVGEDHELLARADVRASEPSRGRRGGSLVIEREIGGVLCLDIRQFSGPSRDAEQEMQRWQDAHLRHFRYERIIVDLRSNPGGSDSFTLGWIADHVRTTIGYPATRMWTIDGKRLSYWNLAAVQQIMNGRDSLSEVLRDARPEPTPASRLRIEPDDETIPAGSDPWEGRMLVLIDRLSASAAESTAWLLREAFGARLVGGRSGGFLTYGDLAPYVLPRSGLLIEVATHWFGWRDVEMVGLPVDVPLDPLTPLEAVTADFDALYA